MQSKLREIYKNNIFTIYKEGRDVSFSLKEPGDKKEFAAPFAIITAVNPMNEKLSDKENGELNKLLKSEILSLNLPFYRCAGGYKEHSEESFMVYNISKENALALGVRYNQYSIFYNDTHTLSYIECGSEKILVEKFIS